MGKILDAFFKDELLVSAAPEKRSPEHQKLCEKSNELIEELKRRLQGEDGELFNALVDTLFAESCCTENNMFQRGYRIGVLMTMEVFEDYDSLIGKGNGRDES